MSDKIEKPMSEASIRESYEKEKRPREEGSPDSGKTGEVAKRRELEALSPSKSIEVIQENPEKDPQLMKTSQDLEESAVRENQTNHVAREDESSIADRSAESSSITETPRKTFGSSQGFGGLSGVSVFSSGKSQGNAFSAMLPKGSSSGGFSSLLDQAPKVSIFDQYKRPLEADKGTNAKAAADNDGGDDDDEGGEVAQADDEQYVVVKGLEKTSVPTGEENEICIHLARAKLYAIDPRKPDAGWKERGTGNLRVLQDKQDRTRLVMRADGVLRVILNMPLHPEYKVEDGGDSMGEKTIRLFGVEDGQGVWLAIRVASKKAAEELKTVVKRGMTRNAADVPKSINQKPADTQDQVTPERRIKGIVPHRDLNSESNAASASNLDAVERTEVTHEKDIEKEKQASEEETPITSKVL